jgi:hypothetical protein
MDQLAARRNLPETPQSESNMISISVRPIIVRLLLLALLVAGVVTAGYRIVVTALSDSLASYVDRTPTLSTAARLEAVDLAVRSAPFDPLARLRRGGSYLAVATEEDDQSRAEVAVEEIRVATEIRPRDYRNWLAYGRALDRIGDPATARRALDRSLQLAPAYFEPHWALANHLLRNGDREGAFVQMRQALELRPAAFSLIFDYAWDAYQGDVPALTRALAPRPEVLAKMATLLVRRNQSAAGREVWNQIASPTPAETREFTISLLQSGQPGAAWSIWNAAGLAENSPPDDGSILSNGGFEKRIQPGSTTPFRAWRIGSGGGVRVTVDRKEPAEGAQSLRVSFSLENNQPVTVATQTVPAIADREYCLTFAIRTEELKSLSLPRVEIFDTASPDRAHAETPPFSGDLAGWTDQSLRIRTAASTESLSVRLQRPPCADPFCSIEGRLWLDRFKLDLCPKAAR